MRETPELKMFKEISKAINLRHLIRKNEEQHILFYPIPKSSHLYIKSRAPKGAKKMFVYYENLLQIVAVNFSILFDLDEIYNNGLNG